MDDLANFEFQLIGTSRNLEYVSTTQPKKKRDDYDLRFGEQPGYMIISEDGNRPHDQHDRFATVIIDAMTSARMVDCRRRPLLRAARHLWAILRETRIIRR